MDERERIARDLAAVAHRMSLRDATCDDAFGVELAAGMVERNEFEGDTWASESFDAQGTDGSTSGDGGETTGTDRQDDFGARATYIERWDLTRHYSDGMRELTSTFTFDPIEAAVAAERARWVEATEALIRNARSLPASHVSMWLDEMRDPEGEFGSTGHES